MAALVERPRLIRLLEDDGLPVVLLRAPAGWGKTTLLSEWARSSDRPVAWLTVEAEHRDGERLVRAIGAAMGGRSRAGRSAGSIVDSGQPVAERARALGASLAPSVLTGFVIDDAHLADGNGTSVLGAFVEALPPQILVRIGSRERPDWVAARDLVHGRVREVTAGRLALDADEAARVFVGHECADDGFLARVLGLTEGWPAGVRAIRMLVDRLGDAEAAIDALRRDGDGLGEYFAREVLAHLEPGDRRTLSRVSVLDSVTPSTCRYVTRDARAWLRLVRMSRRGAFVTADATDSELRVHALLRDELQRRMKERSPARAARLHMHAARGYARSGSPETAIDHVLRAFELANAAGNPAGESIGARASALLESSASSVLMRGGRSWFVERANRIPEAIRTSRPYLARLIAWLNRDETGADSALPPIDLKSPRARHARCMDAAIGINRALRAGDARSLTGFALDARSHLPPGDGFLRSVVVSLLQVAYRFGGDPEVARAAIAETTILARVTGRPAETVQARAMLGILHMMQGRLHAAEEALRHGLELAEHALGDGAPQTAMCHQFIGYVAYEWDDLERAVSHLEQAVAIARPHGHGGILTGALRVLAVTRLRFGDDTGARAAMGELERFLVTPSISARNREWLDGVRIAFTLAAGSTEGVASWIVRWRYNARVLATRPVHELHARFQELFVLCEALVALGRSREALPLIRALGTAAASGERLPFRVLSLVLEAAALESIGETAVAESALGTAVRLARPETMVRVIADGPRLIAGVLGRLHADPAEAPFLARLRSAAGATTADTLTARERDVLTLLARGLSNKAMARELGLSLATIKTHLNHLYAKLDASSRTHAVARARQTGYLQDEPAH